MWRPRHSKSKGRNARDGRGAKMETRQAGEMNPNKDTGSRRDKWLVGSQGQ